MKLEMPNMDTVKQGGMNLAFAAIGNMLLFGASKYVKQLPLPAVSMNSAIASTVVSGLAASAAQGLYNAYTEGDKAKESPYIKLAALAALVIGSNMLLTVDALKSKVSFLDMDLTSSAMHGATSLAAVVLGVYMATPKPAWVGGVPAIEKIGTDATAAQEAVTKAEEAVADDDKRDPAVTQRLAAALKAAQDQLAAVKAQYASLKNFTLTELEKAAVTALGQNQVLVPPASCCYSTWTEPSSCSSC
jgi:hypothetical protein